MNNPLSDELKKIQMSMFIEVIEICKKYSLKYYVLGGTALGAVRHGGFIPWDDDIDIGMPRTDYDKFIDIAQNELSPNLFLQTFDTDPEYAMNYAKVRNSETTFIEKSVQKLKINHGIYLDIFPLDGVPNKLLSIKIRKIQEIILKSAVSRIFSFEKKSSLKLKLFRFVAGIIYSDYKIARDKIDKLIRKYSYDTCEVVANYCGAWGEKEIMPKEYFGSGEKAMFENIEVILPAKYDLYLKQLYGDYMKFPPEEKRVGHHYCTVIDTKISYKNYV